MNRLNKTKSAVFLYCKFSLFLKDPSCLNYFWAKVKLFPKIWFIRLFARNVEQAVLVIIHTMGSLVDQTVFFGKWSSLISHKRNLNVEQPTKC